jgi:hypothetical protein
MSTKNNSPIFNMNYRRHPKVPALNRDLQKYDAESNLLDQRTKINAIAAR